MNCSKLDNNDSVNESKLTEELKIIEIPNYVKMNNQNISSEFGNSKKLIIIGGSIWTLPV